MQPLQGWNIFYDIEGLKLIYPLQGYYIDFIKYSNSLLSIGTLAHQHINKFFSSHSHIITLPN
jgi:hypothetical protein